MTETVSQERENRPCGRTPGVLSTAFSLAEQGFSKTWIVADEDDPDQGGLIKFSRVIHFLRDHSSLNCESTPSAGHIEAEIEEILRIK